MLQTLPFGTHLFICLIYKLNAHFVYAHHIMFVAQYEDYRAVYFNTFNQFCTVIDCSIYLFSLLLLFVNGHKNLFKRLLF